MSEKILFVDDEPNVLAGYERLLRKRFALETAAGGEAGLAALAARGPFAVVVSDMRMPGMNGVEFLAAARARHPDTVRLLLTGYADVQSAIDAVNRVDLFRFLTKPCPGDELAAAVDAALTQFRLVTAERDLLEKTLRGSVQVLAEVFALTDPAEFGRAVRVQRLAGDLAARLGVPPGWELDVAAVLSLLGNITLPDGIQAAARRGGRLTPDEQALVDSVPGVSRDLLRPIPRLEPVTDILAYLNKPFAAAARPGLEKTHQNIPFGARVLAVAFDFDTLVDRGVPKQQALTLLTDRAGRYDPAILTALGSMLQAAAEPEVREISVVELVDGMVLAEDLYSDAGVLLLRRGLPITAPGRRRLEAMTAAGQSPKQVRVVVPAA